MAIISGSVIAGLISAAIGLSGSSAIDRSRDDNQKYGTKDWKQLQKDLVNQVRNSEQGKSGVFDGMSDDVIIQMLQEQGDVRTKGGLAGETFRKAGGLFGGNYDDEGYSALSGFENMDLDKGIDTSKIDDLKRAIPDMPILDDISQNVDEDYDNDLNLLLSSLGDSRESTMDTFDSAREGLLTDSRINKEMLHRQNMNQSRSQRQRAIEMGASAGVKMATNINSLMSTQNSLRQQSMDTANNLSQMALQQQRSLMDISGQEAQAQTQYGDVARGRETENRFNTKLGTYDTQRGIYEQERDRHISSNYGDQSPTYGAAVGKYFDKNIKTNNNRERTD